MKQITVVIPTIAERSEDLLLRAMHSVERQSIGLKNIDIHVMSDVDRLGPALMRNHGVKRAETEYVAFLDDDDEMYPHHLEGLLEEAERTQADVVYPWFDWDAGGYLLPSPIDTHYGKPFDPVALLASNYIPVTTLVRRDAFIQAGGFPTPDEFEGPEDWGLWLRLLEVERQNFVHLPEYTWRWHQHTGQTGKVL